MWESTYEQGDGGLPADDVTCTQRQGCHVPEHCRDHEALSFPKAALCSCRCHTPTSTLLLVIRRRGKNKQAPFKRNELGWGLEELAIISWASEHGKGFQHCPKPSHPPNARAFKRKKWVLKEHSFSRGPGRQLLHTYDKVTWHFVFSVYQMLHFPEKNKGQFSTKEHQSQD